MWWPQRLCSSCKYSNFFRLSPALQSLFRRNYVVCCHENCDPISPTKSDDVLRLLISFDDDKLNCNKHIICRGQMWACCDCVLMKLHKIGSLMCYCINILYGDHIRKYTRMYIIHTHMDINIKY